MLADPGVVGFGREARGMDVMMTRQNLASAGGQPDGFSISAWLCHANRSVFPLLVCGAVVALTWAVAPAPAPADDSAPADAEKPTPVHPDVADLAHGAEQPPLPVLTTAERAAYLAAKLGPTPRFKADTRKRLFSGEPVVERADLPDGRRITRAWAIMDHTPGEVMAFMRNYEVHPRYFRKIKRAKVVHEENDQVFEVDFAIDAAGLFTMEYKSRQRFLGDRLYEYVCLGGDLKTQTGMWKLFPLKPGEGGTPRTLVEIKLWLISPVRMLQMMEDRILIDEISSYLTALKKGLVDQKAGNLSTRAGD